ncbi:hydroxyacylglutathione hydrolase [uncultured Gammaproteobacteria bacterium]
MIDQDPTLTIGDFQITVVVNSPPWFQNCYVVRHGPTGEQFVIDPGGEADRIAAVVVAGGGALKEILLTHGHPDHLGAVRALQDRFGVPCLAHGDERATIEALPTWARAMMQMRIDLPSDCRYFTNEPKFSHGTYAVQAFQCPGHTPGGICLLFDGFAFIGDTLFNQGVGRTDLPGGDSDQLVGSITRLLGLLDDKVVLFSGHGPEWTAGAARSWWRYAQRMF